MTRKAYKKLHKDFKSDDPKNPRTTKYNPKTGGTESHPVKFVGEEKKEKNCGCGQDPCITYGDHRHKKDKVTEAKVDKGRSDYGKASIRNYRRKGPGHGDPGMFDPSGKRGKTIDLRRKEHEARRGKKGAKVPAYKVEHHQKDKDGNTIPHEGEEINEEEKSYKVRVTDKKTKNSYVRMASRSKIAELRSNPNISSVEMTEYGSPTKSEKYKGLSLIHI